MFRHIWLTMALCLLVSGCGTVARNETSPSPQNNNETVRAQQTAPEQQQPLSNDQVATHLEQLARSIQGVRNAHCVIFGNTAIVGIDVNQDLERSRVGTIKYSVAEAFRKDPMGINAIVTADMDLQERVREISHDIAQGRPIAGFAEELADIIGRIVPQLPRDTVDPEQMEKNDTPKMQKSL